MKTLNILFVLFLILSFCSGIYVMTNNTLRIETAKYFESMENKNFCPDTLMEKTGHIELYNSSFPDDKITFVNLEDYNEYIKIQKERGVECPVLELQHNNDTNNSTPASIIDASREHPPYNIASYPSFDPYGLQNGTFTELDVIHNSMDKKWAGMGSGSPKSLSLIGTSITV